MNASFDIVDLIENNPITKLSTTYQNKLLTKIKTKFTENEQQIFVASFYGFLNYDSKMDFVIDLDDVWKWVGFSNKAHSKHLLEKNFIIAKDYKLLLTKPGEQRMHIKGGHNKEIIMLNVATFKKFCLKAGTKRQMKEGGHASPLKPPQLTWCRKPMIFCTFSFQLPKRRGAGNYVPRR